MKRIFLTLTLIFTACEEDRNDGCIDESKITNDPCPTVWDPVCGCDEKTYGNACTAGSSGVLSWTKGECK